MGTGFKTTVKNEDAYLANPNPLIPPFKPLGIEQPTYQTALNGGLMFVPIISNNSCKDPTFRPKYGCPKIGNDFFQNINITEGNLNIELKDQLDIFARNMTRAGYSPKKIFGTDSVTIQNVNKFKDFVYTHTYQFGKKPDGIDDNFYAAIDTFGSLHYINAYDSYVLKYHTTNLIRNIFKELDKKVEKPEEFKDLKYAGFSGQDSNLSPFFVALGLSSRQCLLEMIKNGGVSSSNPECKIEPHFAANIIYELSSSAIDSSSQGQNQDFKSFYIRVIVNGEPVSICKKEEEEAGGYCPYKIAKENQFEKMAISEEEFEKACHSEESNSKGNKSGGKQEGEVSSFYFWGFIVTLVVVAFSLALNVYLILFRGIKEKATKNEFQESNDSKCITILENEQSYGEV